MSPMIFGTAFCFGAGAIALWTDNRLPRLMPEEMRGILLHTMIAFVLLHFVARIVGPLASSGPLAAIASVLLVGLPAVVYAFLVGVWTIRLFQGAAARYR